MDALVERAAGQKLAVGRERDAVDGLRVFGEGVDALAALHVPKSHGRVEAGAGQYEVHVGVLGAGTGRRPLDGVNLFRMGL